MRELTFRGFLTEYVRKLSYANTTSMQKLMQEAASENFRLREPLLLYALFAHKTHLFFEAAAKYRLPQEYTELLLQYTPERMEHALLCDTTLPDAYKKVYSSYLVRKNQLASDNHTKELMRQTIRKLQQQRSLTNYRIYTELGLNPGNLNAWLKHGDNSKVSLSTARSVLKFAKEYC